MNVFRESKTVWWKGSCCLLVVYSWNSSLSYISVMV